MLPQLLTLMLPAVLLFAAAVGAVLGAWLLDSTSEGDGGPLRAVTVFLVDTADHSDRPREDWRP